MPSNVSAQSKEYLTLADAADRMGVSTATLRRRITDGQLRAFRMGKRLIRIRVEDLDRMLKEIPNVLTGTRRPRWR
jgi:excisionase family DNA binding protein